MNPADRNGRLRQFGLSPGQIEALDRNGDLPGYALGGAVGTPQTGPGGLDLETLLALETSGWLPKGASGQVGQGGAPPITTLDMPPPAAPGAMAPPPTAQELMDAGIAADAGQFAAPAAPTPGTPQEALAQGIAADSGQIGAPAPAAPLAAGMEAGAQAAPTDVVMYQGGGAQPAGYAGPAGLPGEAAGTAGAAGTGIPTAPTLQAPDLSGAIAAQQQVTAAQSAEQQQKAQAIEQAKERMAVQDAAWAATETQWQGLITAAREHAGKNPVAEWGTGQKIMAGLAIFLGTLGAAMAKTPNYALGIIDKAIEQEIDSRKDALAALERQFGSAREARAALKAGLLENLRLDLEERTARAQSEIVKQQGAVLEAQLGQQQVELENGMQQRMFSNNMEIGKLTVEERQIGATQRAAQVAQQQKMVERYVPGVGVMRTDDDVVKAKTLKLTADEVIRTVGELRKIRREHKLGSYTDREAVARAESMGAKLVGMLRLPYTGPGILTDSEREMLQKKVIGDPLSIFTLSSTVMTKLDTLEKSMNGMVADMRRMALRPEGGQGGGGAGGQGGQGGGVPSFRRVGEKR